MPRPLFKSYPPTTTLSARLKPVPDVVRIDLNFPGGLLPGRGLHALLAPPGAAGPWRWPLHGLRGRYRRSGSKLVVGP
jgi:hypothetical protein